MVAELKDLGTVLSKQKYLSFKKNVDAIKHIINIDFLNFASRYEIKNLVTYYETLSGFIEYVIRFLISYLDAKFKKTIHSL